MKLTLLENFDRHTAVIIKDDPDVINKDQYADDFYFEVQRYLERSGYQVTMVENYPGIPIVRADVWIGHANGQERLKEAPEGTLTVKIGNPKAQHPYDDGYQYVLTDDIKQELDLVLAEIK